MSCTTGIPSVSNFRCNGIYDPDQTGSGHQPLGHDEVALLYRHYVVLGSKITVRAIPTTSASGVPMIIALQTKDVTTGPASATNLIENNRSSYRIMGGLQGGASSHTGGLTLSKTYSPKRFYNIVDTKDNLNRLGATFGADPTEEAFFQLSLTSLDEASSTNAVSFSVDIEYTVALSEPHQIGQS